MAAAGSSTLWERERCLQSFTVLIYSPNAYNIQGCTRPNQVSRFRAPGSDYWNCHLLSHRLGVSRKLETEAKPELKPIHSDTM